MEQKGDCAYLTTTTTTSATIDNNNNNNEEQTQYLNELLQEMRQMNRMRAVQPDNFNHAASLLSAEISRVWDLIYIRQEEKGDATPVGRRGRPAVPTIIQLQEKIPFPADSQSGRDEHGRRLNLIGRILGPNGLSVRQLEYETDTTILIRGNGSIKDPARQERLMGQPGWEHLDEPLHAVITAKDTSHDLCQKKLNKAVNIINQLLTTGNDEYKKQQLIQLAVMNGTYRPGPRSK